MIQLNLVLILSLFQLKLLLICQVPSSLIRVQVICQRPHLHVELNVVSLLIVQNLELMQVEMNDNNHVILTRLEEGMLNVAVVNVHGGRSLSGGEPDAVRKGLNLSN